MEVSLQMYSLDSISDHVKSWEDAVKRHVSKSLLKSEIPTNSSHNNIKLRQTCGWPLISNERSEWRVVGVPIYEAPGCTSHLYSSVIVVNEASKWHDKERLLHAKELRIAINGIRSCSGHLMLGAFLGPEVFGRFDRFKKFTGSHMASIRAVADCEADLASIDCVTWALAKKHMPQLTKNIKIIEHSPTCIGLPYVTNLGHEHFESIREGIREALNDPDPEVVTARKNLLIADFEFRNELVGIEKYEKAIKDLMKKACHQDIKAVEPTPVSILKSELRSLIESHDIKCIMQAKAGLEKAIRDNMQPNEKFTYVHVKSHDSAIRVWMASQKDLWPRYSDKATRPCVAFFGERPPFNELELENDHLWYDRCWKADKLIVDNFDMNVVDAYVTSQTEPGGDSFNLVVLAKGKSAADFTENNYFHGDAVREISSHYYKKVRIHRCLISNDGSVFVKQTISCTFSRGKNVDRRIIQW